MKKVLLLFVIALGLASDVAVRAQVQRLVTLPMTMNTGEEGLASLCIDLFRPGPTGNDYRVSGSGGDRIYHSDDYRKVTPPPGGSTPSGPMFLSIGDEGVPGYYKKFIKAKIEEYGGSFSATRKGELQFEIWAFNGMDKLGWIDRSALDPVAEFERKKPKFIWKYNISDDVGVRINAKICFKAKQLHSISLEPLPLPRPDNVHFTREGISCTQDGQRHLIEVRYDGVSYSGVRDGASIDSKIQSYYTAYHTVPDEADFASTDDPSLALLTFTSSGDDFGSFDLNFQVPNNSSTKIKNLFPDLSKYYCLKR